jgi:ketosteroid isomerase-like protein
MRRRSVASPDFDEVVQRHHDAADAFMRGDDEPLAQLYSHADDVTLGNPFGPFVRGFDQVAETMRQAAEHYRDGEASGFESVARYVSDDLVCTVEVEHLRAKVGGREEIMSLSLRVTCVFRREDGQWKLVSRHADPITTPRSADSVIEG